MRSLREAVYVVVRAIPAGEVLTYGEIAAEAGAPGAARAVGAIMASSEGFLPWWRVVTASGRLVPDHEAEHERLLRLEGVAMRKSHVVMGPARAGRMTSGQNRLGSRR